MVKEIDLIQITVLCQCDAISSDIMRRDDLEVEPLSLNHAKTYTGFAILTICQIELLGVSKVKQFTQFVFISWCSAVRKEINYPIYKKEFHTIVISFTEFYTCYRHL